MLIPNPFKFITSIEDAKDYWNIKYEDFIPIIKNKHLILVEFESNFNRALIKPFDENNPINIILHIIGSMVNQLNHELIADKYYVASFEHYISAIDIIRLIGGDLKGLYYYLTTKNKSILYKEPTNLSIQKINDNLVYYNLPILDYAIYCYDNIDKGEDYLLVTILFRKLLSKYYDMFNIKFNDNYVYDNDNDLIVSIVNSILSRV